MAKVTQDIEDVSKFIDNVESSVKKPAAAIPPAKQTDDERKNGLIKRILSSLKLRDIEFPADAEEKLFIYADEKSLFEMTKVTKRVDLFKDLLASQSISIRGYTDD